MSLMAELGEGPPPDATEKTTVQRKAFNIFDAQMAPRPLMPPPMSSASGTSVIWSVFK